MIAFLIIFNTILLTLLAVRFINYLQLDGYKITPNRKSIAHYTKIVIADLVGIIVMTGMYLVSSDIFNILAVIGFAVPILTIVGWDMLEEHKTPLKYTHRILRYFTVLILILLGILTGLVIAGEKYIEKPGIFLFIPYLLLPVIIIFAFYAVMPIEYFIKKRYIDKTSKILLSRGDLIKIGVTGSYGKTTCKNILNTILSKHFKILASPNSFNTPMGLARTVGMIEDETQIIVMEMGARHKGDIKEMCDVFKPQIGIITGIAPQHLKTFGSIEQIVNTKYELIASLPNDGMASFNGENEWVRRMFFRAKITDKTLIRVNYGYIYCSDVSTSSKGTDFMLHIGEEEYSASTKLIGKHNLENILLAVCVADYLEMPHNLIVEGIAELEYAPHRLEIIKADNGVTIIDDSYNCNPVGCKVSLNALGLFEGRKIVASQGMVELGEIETEENYKLGVGISAVADLVFLIGVNAKIMRKGLLDSGYNPTKIIMCDNLKKATDMFADVLTAGDVLLLMNDLPDNY